MKKNSNSMLWIIRTTYRMLGAEFDKLVAKGVWDA
jgi:hypothetical protein